MTRTTNQIIDDLQTLLDELRGHSTAGGKPTGSTPSKKKLVSKKDEFSGCMGGLLFLVQDGYFDEPRTKEDITKKLEEQGRYYSSELISMNLKNLFKKGRAINRLGSKGSYKFVARK